MQRRQFTKIVGSSLAAVAAPALIRPARAADPVKIGFIYLGPVGDFGWTYQHDLGRQATADHYGDKIKTTYVENVPEGPDSEKVLNDLANSGHQLIFATSFGYMNYVVNSAKRHPKTFYEHATGYKRAANIASYNIRFYQARFVQGVIAGKLSKAGLAGYVGSVPVPEVVQGLNAFMLGMQSINPKARLKFILINSWYDPPKEGDAAKALIDQGCDILTQHTDSPAPLQAAAARGIKAFGQSTDMAKFAPGTELTASVDNWTPYYIKRVGEVLDGTWKSTDTWGGFDSSLLTMSPFTNMPEDVAALATATELDIKSGKNKVFVGPIADQSGAEKVPAGKTLDDGELNSMQWLVQGIDGRLS
ncbi:MAG: BMP family ABC transporter substrate-binding protein [Acetobacteraceae bacterium]|nr:BMP family ABC transporter substrate-binding protein [Acetobacteraceae bacterium]